MCHIYFLIRWIYFNIPHAAMIQTYYIYKSIILGVYYGNSPSIYIPHIQLLVI